MSNSRTKFDDLIDELSLFSDPDKVLFCELLIFQFTLTNRGIWSDIKLQDKEKVDAMKWLNELSHRIWNIIFDLKNNKGDDSISRLYENIKFYSGQSDFLKMHLGPTILAALENFNNQKKN